MFFLSKIYTKLKILPLIKRSVLHNPFNQINHFLSASNKHFMNNIKKHRIDAEGRRWLVREEPYGPHTVKSQIQS